MNLIALGKYVSTYSANTPHAVKRHTYVKTSVELEVVGGYRMIVDQRQGKRK